MSTEDIPTITIDNLSPNDSPLGEVSDILVDDTIILVDDTTSLVGSQVTKVDKVNNIIRIYH